MARAKHVKILTSTVPDARRSPNDENCGLKPAPAGVQAMSKESSLTPVGNLHPTPAKEPAQAWKQLLSELEQVPAHDIRWDSAESFIESLSVLATRKIGERQFAIELETRINRLASHPRRPSCVVFPSLSGLDIALWSRLDETSSELITLLDQLDEKIGAITSAPSDSVSNLLMEASSLSRGCNELWTNLSRLASGEVIAGAPTVIDSHVSTGADPQREAEIRGSAQAWPGTREAPDSDNELQSSQVLPVDSPPAQESSVAEATAEEIFENEPLEPLVSPDAAEEPYRRVAETVTPTDSTVNAVTSQESAAYTAWTKERATNGDRGTREHALDVLARPEELGYRRALLYALISDGRWSESYWLSYSLTIDRALPDLARDECSRLETLLNVLLAVISFPSSPEQSISVIHAAILRPAEECEQAFGFYDRARRLCWYVSEIVTALAGPSSPKLPRIVRDLGLFTETPNTAAPFKRGGVRV
jgi:hypothetical protein